MKSTIQLVRPELIDHRIADRCTGTSKAAILHQKILLIKNQSKLLSKSRIVNIKMI